MASIKEIISRNFTGFAYFYRHVKYRLFLLLVLSIGIGILDGFGLAMFLPLLQMVSGAENQNGASLHQLNYVVDAMGNIGFPLTLLNVLMLMIVFFTLKGVAKFISQAYRTIIQQYFIRQLREQLFKALNQIRYKFFVTSDAGRIQNTLSGEVERVAYAFQSYIMTIENVILTSVYVAFAFFIDARFALFVTAGGWLTNLLYKIVYKKTIQASREFSKDSSRYQGLIVQYVSNFKYLKATSLLGTYAGHLQDSILKIELSRRKIGILGALLQAMREPLLIIVVSGVILIQTMLLGAALAPILISLLFFYRALTSLVAVQTNWNNYLSVSGSMENVVDFQKDLQTNKEHQGNLVFHKLQHHLHLDKVSFSYVDEPVLNNINLTVAKGETVAFVGESGSGKTTLVNLFAGLIPLDHGLFKIDGIDRKELNISDYQKRIGYVTQEPVIFNDTVFNNVTFWAEPDEANTIQFREALKKAAINDLVDELPGGAETMLGNNGINLSGGQKQRISIARELYKDIDVLILDEATSALDSESEKLIQASIDQLKGHYTILVVAHRLSTIRNADRIVLMKGGRVEDVGDFEGLMQRTATFKRMVELQEL
ncbi:MAG: ABC transporter ATP-binding protein [Salinivirgaceae bacterium]|nr:ABC transporter ATP-binding protein [Salinivirgaceae bacterium]